MPGRIISEPTREHVCADKPVADRYARGTQWQCDECHTIWVLVVGAQYNESYSAWRVMTERNRNGQDNS